MLLLGNALTEGGESGSLSGSSNISHYVPVVKSNGFIIFYAINGIILKETAAASYHLGTFCSQKLNLWLCVSVCSWHILVTQKTMGGSCPAGAKQLLAPSASPTLYGAHRSKHTLCYISITLLSSAILARSGFHPQPHCRAFTNSPLSLYLLFQPRHPFRRSGWVPKPAVSSTMQSPRP